VTEILNDGSAKTISGARNTPFLNDINFLGVKDQFNNYRLFRKKGATH